MVIDPNKVEDIIESTSGVLDNEIFIVVVYIEIPVYQIGN